MADGHGVALDAVAHDDFVGAVGDVRMVSEFFALVRVGEVDLDHRTIECEEGVEDRDGSMCVGRWVDDDRGGFFPGLLDPIDEGTLMVGLAEVDFQSRVLGFVAREGLYIGERVRAVNFRLASPQHVEVGAVEDEDRLCHAPSVAQVWGGFT